jgi:hypothetical protein
LGRACCVNDVFVGCAFCQKVVGCCFGNLVPCIGQKLFSAKRSKKMARPPPPLLRPLRRHLRLRLRVGPGLPAFPPPCPRPRLALLPLPRLLQAGRTRLLQAGRVNERLLGYARVPGYCTSITRMATECFTCARRIASAPRTFGRANLYRSMPRGQPPARTGTTCARHACAESRPT